MVIDPLSAHKQFHKMSNQLQHSGLQESEKNLNQNSNGNGVLQPSLNKDGFLEFAPQDRLNPRSWSFARKCYYTGTVILLVMNATFASSAPSANVNGIAEDLHVSVEAAGLVTTMFLLGYCAGPLVWAPLSEFYG